MTLTPWSPSPRRGRGNQKVSTPSYPPRPLSRGKGGTEPDVFLNRGETSRHSDLKCRNSRRGRSPPIHRLKPCHFRTPVGAPDSLPTTTRLQNCGTLVSNCRT